MTKITYHLKSGKAIVSDDGKSNIKESARYVADFLSSDGNVEGTGTTDHVTMIPARSVDCVELEK